MIWSLIFQNLKLMIPSNALICFLEIWLHSQANSGRCIYQHEASSWLKGALEYQRPRAEFCSTAKVNELNLVSAFEVGVRGEASVTPGSINEKTAPQISSYLCSSRFWDMTTETRTSQARYWWQNGASWRLYLMDSLEDNHYKRCQRHTAATRMCKLLFVYLCMVFYRAQKGKHVHFLIDNTDSI